MSSFVSSGSGASQSMAEGRAQNMMYKRQAQAALMEGQLKAEEIQKEEEEMLGRQRTLYAKAGVDITEGSPLLMAAQTAKESELAQRRTMWESSNKYRMLRWAGRLAKKGGQMGAISQGVNAVANVAGLALGGLTSGMGGGSTFTTSSGMTAAGAGGSGLNWSFNSFLRNLWR